MRQPLPGIFSQAIRTADSLGDRLENAAAAGLRIDVQEPGFDLDRVGDLGAAGARALTGNCTPMLSHGAYLDEKDLWRYAKNF